MSVADDIGFALETLARFPSLTGMGSFTSVRKVMVSRPIIAPPIAALTLGGGGM